MISKVKDFQISLDANIRLNKKLGIIQLRVQLAMLNNITELTHNVCR